jgi:hypothetical protein
MQLGALTRLLSSTLLLNHSLDKDYQALSVAKLLQEVMAAECPTWYGMFVQEEKNDHYRYTVKQQLPHKPHECPAPGNAFNIAVSSIAQGVGQVWLGLCLKSY